MDMNIKMNEKQFSYLVENIDIDSTESLFDYLKGYTDLFDSNIKFGMYYLRDDEYYFYDGHISVESKEIQRKISELSFKENELEEYEDLSLFPIFVDSIVEEICIFKSIKAQDKFYNKLLRKNIMEIQKYRTLLKKNSKLYQLSHSDEVTGLFNQRKLTLDLESTIEDHLESKDAFSLMFIDVDHFKDVNDNYGHIVGSQMLIDIGRVLKNLLRESDDIYRYGGDEFIVIMRKVNIKIVHKIALRILDSIKNKKFEISENISHKLSVSVGIAEFPKDAQTSKEIIKFADEMMYESKKSGRGKVFHLGHEVKNDSTSTK